MSTKQLILAGGGDADQSTSVDMFFASLIHEKKFLFVPHAISPEIWSYQQSLEWVKKPEAFSKIDIRMETEIGKISYDYALDFAAIYLMGGNTYKLMKLLRESGLDSVLARYMDAGGVVYGISAGAIVMGTHIESAAIGPEKDENLVGLVDLAGMDMLNGWNAATHYVDDMDKELIELSSRSRTKIIGIPESSGVYVKGKKATVLGRDSIVIVDRKKKRTLQMGESFEF